MHSFSKLYCPGCSLSCYCGAAYFCIDCVFLRASVQHMLLSTVCRRWKPLDSLIEPPKKHSFLSASIHILHYRDHPPFMAMMQANNKTYARHMPETPKTSFQLSTHNHERPEMRLFTRYKTSGANNW